MDLANKIRGSFEAILQGDPVRIKESTEFFTQCEKDPGFTWVLFQFVESTTEHEAIRFQAFMLIKNIILRHWKRRGTPSAPGKLLIREHVTNLSDDPATKTWNSWEWFEDDVEVWIVF